MSKQFCKDLKLQYMLDILVRNDVEVRYTQIILLFSRCLPLYVATTPFQHMIYAFLTAQLYIEVYGIWFPQLSSRNLSLPVSFCANVSKQTRLNY